MKTFSITAITTLIILISSAFANIFSQSPKMILVSGGTFKMGSNLPDPDGLGDEKPVHTVTISDFYIGETEVKVSDYQIFSKATGIAMPQPPEDEWWESHPDTKKFYNNPAKKWWGFQPNYPMFHVSWENAVLYCNWLSKKEGLNECYKKNADGGWDFDITKTGYRLPTEAEWEFAARGGNNSKGYKYSGSNSLSEVAWYDETTALAGPQNVKTKKPNELGIYDMSGNVWEWCSDYYSAKYYTISEGKTNPVNLTSQPYRVLRGGSWHYQGSYATITSRDGPEIGFTNYNYGFRLARTK